VTHFIAMVLFSLLVSIAFAALSQPAIAQKMHEQRAKMFDKQVESGKMSRKEADSALDSTEKIGAIATKIGAPVASIVFGFVAVFWWAFLFWLISRRVLGAPVPFMKAAEVAGLASMIGVLGVVVKLLLMVALGNPSASLSLGMLVRNPEAHGQLLALLSLVDPIIFWLLVVRSIGLARLAGVSTLRAVPWVFGCWAVVTGFFVALGLLAQKVFGGM